MAYGNVKNEKKEHGSLLNLLKKHFSKDEDDMEEMDEDLGQVMKPMPVKKRARLGRQEKAYEADDEPYDPDYDSDPDMDLPVDMLEDGEYDDEDDEEDDEFADDEPEEQFSKPSKEQRKRMSIVAIGKKFSKPRKEM